MNEILNLYSIFFRIGGITFGGGYAMLPMIQKEIVEKYDWATEEEILDFYALGQCTPGIIAVNTATLIGYKRKGIAGGIAATLGMITPSLIIISIISLIFYRFQEYKMVQHAFNGIKVGVVSLIVFTVVKMWKKAVRNWIGLAIFTVSFLLFAFLNISPIIVIIGSALTGIVIYINKSKKKSGEKIS